MKRALYCILVFLLFSCHQKFNKRLWEYRDDLGMYPYRKGMLDDVLKTVTIKGRSYSQIVSSLGESTGLQDGKLYYNIVIDYGSDIDPVYGKDLIILFNNNSIATGYEVKEWRP
jgi:hypothetical protein